MMIAVHVFGLVTSKEESKKEYKIKKHTNINTLCYITYNNKFIFRSLYKKHLRYVFIYNVLLYNF